MMVSPACDCPAALLPLAIEPEVELAPVDPVEPEADPVAPEADPVAPELEPFEPCDEPFPLPDCELECPAVEFEPPPFVSSEDVPHAVVAVTTQAMKTREGRARIDYLCCFVSASVRARERPDCTR
jgi:hypothetical protein